ncbi:MAG TPA: AI-2E family transporter, partial [Kofleriaceae bacterium]|nr:AI-2E family transporter [Kofleriaceae bacterium]
MAEQPVPRFFLILVVAAALLLGLTVLPIVTELLLAAVLAGILWPLQQWTTRRARGRRGLAAGLITLVLVVLLVGPVATMAAFVIRDGSDAVRFVSQALRSKDVAALVHRLPAATRDVVDDAIDRLPRDLSEVASHAQGKETAA